MEQTSLFLGLMNLVLGLVVLIMSIPLVRGKVRMNPVFGARVAKSFESEENWDRINRYGGCQLMIWGTVLVLIGIICLVLDLGSSPEITIVLAFAPLLLLVPAIRTVMYAKKL